jgi:hypothetical protein
MRLICTLIDGVASVGSGDVSFVSIDKLVDGAATASG